MIFVNSILHANVISIASEQLFYSRKVLIGFFPIDAFRLYGLKNASTMICSNKFENKSNENHELA